MKQKHKISLGAAVLAMAFLWSGSAKADFWTRYTRTSSGDVLPQYLELENMAKSSNGVKFFYGTDRREMAGAGVDTHNLVTFDGTNWTDQTSAVETANGTPDIEFLNMYADQHGNVWMPNRRDPNVALMKFGADGSWTKITAASIGTQTGLGGDLKIKNLFGNRNSSNYMYAVASNGTRLYVLVYTFDDEKWRDSGYGGGPLIDTDNNTADFWGMYNETDQSFWFYQYHSSENQYSNPQGGDRGAGIWRYKGGDWTQFNKDYPTGNGVALKNGVTEAFIDSSGNVWVGSRYGVFRYDIGAGTWANWTKENSNVFTNRVIKIQQESDGRVWIIALEDETIPEDNGGISIYDNNSGAWEYYTSYNGEDALKNATNIFMIGGDEAWMFTGHGEAAMQAGIWNLTRDDNHTALYGQTSGAVVEKTGFDPQKKKSSTKAQKVTITKKYKVKKKWKKKVVYRGKSTDGWYKKLNLDAGASIKYIIKVGKKSRTVSASSGDPIRLNFL